jgi:ArsR family transcriptional regulator
MTQDAFIKIAKALSDPMRLKILMDLKRGREMTCSCVCDLMPLSQPTVSHHIRALERAGLIRIRKDGQFNRLTVNRDVLDAFAAQLSGGKRAGKRP